MAERKDNAPCEVISLADERTMRESAKRIEASRVQIEPIVRAFQTASEMVADAQRSAKLTLVETELRASDDLTIIARASGITPMQARDLLVRLFELDDVARGRVMAAIEARVERLKGGR